MAASEITLEAVSSVSQIPAEDWDACANPAPDRSCLNGLDTLGGLDTLASPDAAGDSGAGPGFHYNPFVSHRFF
jgi:hypothetical protein